MANYVQLGQGLKSLGDSASGAYDFLNQQRQLDISQQNADTSRSDFELRKRAYEDSEQRKQAKENATGMFAELKTAANATGADGKLVGQANYFDTNAEATNRLVQTLAKTDKDYRDLVGGKPVQAVKGPDGMWVVQTQTPEGTWANVQSPQGEVRFTASDLLNQSKKQMAIYGLAELIDGEKLTDAAYKAGHITEEDLKTSRARTDAQMQEMQQAVEAGGHDPREIHTKAVALSNEQQASGTPVRPAVPASIAAPAAPVPVSGAEQAETKTMDWFKKPAVLSPTTPVLGASTSDPARDARIAARDASLPDYVTAGVEQAVPDDASISRTSDNYLGGVGAGAHNFIDAHRIAGTGALGAVKGVADYRDQVLTKVGDAIKAGWNAGEKSPVASAPVAAQPDTQVVVRDTQNPVQAAQEGVAIGTRVANDPNTTVTQRSAILNRAINTVRGPNIPSLKTSEASRAAAYNYAYAMTVMGHEPDETILSNLASGDDMAGSGAKRRTEARDDYWKAAQQDLEYAKLQEQYYSDEIRRTGNNIQRAGLLRDQQKMDIDMRKQRIAERDASIETAAQAMLSGRQFKDKGQYDMAVNGFKGELNGMLATTAGTFANLGYNQNNVMQDFTTEPTFINFAARYMNSQKGVAANNKKMLSFDKAFSNVGDLAAKISSMQVGETPVIRKMAIAYGADKWAEYESKNVPESQRKTKEELLQEGARDAAARLERVDLRDSWNVDN